MAGMISVIPGTTAQDTAGAFAVLALIGNESEFKKRLDQLVAEKQAAQEALEQSQRWKADTEALSAQIAGKGAQIDAQLADIARREGEINQAKADLAVREATLAAGQAKLADDTAKFLVQRDFERQQTQSTLQTGQQALALQQSSITQDASARSAALDAREKQIQQKEAASDAREQATAVEAEKLKTLRADLEARIARIQAAASGN